MDTWKNTKSFWEEVTKRYTSQRTAAIGLGCEKSTVAKWMQYWGVSFPSNIIASTNLPKDEKIEEPEFVKEIRLAKPQRLLDIVSFDIETTNLTADFSVLLCACLKPFGKKAMVFRGDEYNENWATDRADDRAIVRAIADELSKHAIIVTHYGCLTPGHKVLTADLRWEPLYDLQVGDSLLAFDETAQQHWKQRKFQVAKVIHTGKEYREVWEIELSDGTKLTATPDHRWLLPVVWQEGRWNGYRWYRTDNLSIGQPFCRLLEPWFSNNDNAEGYLAGVFDGEGSLSQKKCEWGQTLDLRFAQNKGAVLDTVEKLLQELDFNFSNPKSAKSTDRKSVV